MLPSAAGGVEGDASDPAALWLEPDDGAGSPVDALPDPGPAGGSGEHKNTFSA